MRLFLDINLFLEVTLEQEKVAEVKAPFFAMHLPTRRRHT